MSAGEENRELRERLVAAETDLLELARTLDRPVRDDEYALTQLAVAARSR